MSLRGMFLALAFVVVADLTLCALNLFMSIPAANITILIQRLIVAVLTCAEV